MVGVVTVLTSTAFVLVQQSAYFAASHNPVESVEFTVDDPISTEDQITTYRLLAAAGWLAGVSWVTLVYFFAGHLTEQTKLKRKS